MKVCVSTVYALLFAATALASPATDEGAMSYDGTKVVRVQLDSSAQAEKLKSLVKEWNLELWTEKIAPSLNVDVQIQLEKFEKFKTELGEFHYSVMHKDLGASIREESESSPCVNVSADMSWFHAYHPYEDHLSFLNKLVRQYPNNSEIAPAGTSFEGRPINGIHIYGSSGGGTKPAVILHGTANAREWITTMVTEFIAYTLLSNSGNSTEIKGYLEKYDFIIFPLVNPDGFAYTQTSNRLWLKNRMRNANSSCIGTDISRNWDAFWETPGGASTNPCDHAYKGDSAGSSPEYRALSDFQNEVKKDQGVKLFMDIRSYMQLWMSPYGYSCSKVALNKNKLQSLAEGAVSAIKAVYGTTFQSGPMCNTTYQATGSSVDYAYDITGIEYVYSVALRDTSNYGFILPTTQIYPSGVEFWAGLNYVLANIV